MDINVRWNKDSFKIDGLSSESILMDLKMRLFEKTLVLPNRQKIMGFKNIKNYTDDDKLSTLNVKHGMKLMMMGTNDELEEYINNDEVVNDMDYLGEEEKAIPEREENLTKINNRINSYKINILQEPRPGKNLLVLDIDGTIFDNKSYAERGRELMRPYLHEFLTTAYKTFDIVIWSATSLKYIEAKVRQLGMVDHPNYKINFILDHVAMISVYTQESGLVDVKPLGVVWGKFPQHYNSQNTIIVDDCSRNFLMNPQNGLKIYAFQNSHVNKETDVDLLWLGHYLDQLSIHHGSDFSGLDHKRWKKYIKKLTEKDKMLER